MVIESTDDNYIFVKISEVKSSGITKSKYVVYGKRGKPLYRISYTENEPSPEAIRNLVDMICEYY